MPRQLKALLIEDSPDDAQLVVYELERGDFIVEWKRVQSTEELKEVLRNYNWDIVLCDYTMPQLNAIEALKIINKISPDLPCIIVSGTIGEETAVSAMLAGAKDYFVKGRLTRLNAAIHRELMETENRRLRLKAEQELRDSERFRWMEREDALKRETEARQKIESLYKETQESNRLKDEFLHNLSHELRTPMNAVMGWAALLVNKDCDPQEYQKIFESIYRNAQTQNKLIDDLLDLSRILSGKLALESTVVNFVTVVQAAMEPLKLSAQAKNIRLNFQTNSPEIIVRGDSTRLQEIVWNLLSNAVKFTPNDGNINLSLTRFESLVELKVNDSGEGIDPDFLPHIFDRFRQADSSLTRRHGGLGLGLSIVRHLTELHGGEVEAHSPGVGKGATFIVRLPLFNEPLSSIEGNESSVSIQKTTNEALQGLRLLIVDDQQDILTLFDYVLKKQGADVTLASSAEQAIRLFKETMFDLLLCDIEMPEKNGYELIQELRNYEHEVGRPQTPAAALTAHVLPEDINQALSAGFNTHLSKPISPQKLIDAIVKIIGR